MRGAGRQIRICADHRGRLQTELLLKVAVGVVEDHIGSVGNRAQLALQLAPQFRNALRQRARIFLITRGIFRVQARQLVRGYARNRLRIGGGHPDVRVVGAVVVFVVPGVFVMLIVPMLVMFVMFRMLVMLVMPMLIMFIMFIVFVMLRMLVMVVLVSAVAGRKQLHFLPLHQRHYARAALRGDDFPQRFFQRGTDPKDQIGARHRLALRRLQNGVMRRLPGFKQQFRLAGAGHHRRHQRMHRQQRDRHFGRGARRRRGESEREGGKNPLEFRGKFQGVFHGEFHRSSPGRVGKSVIS